MKTTRLLAMAAAAAALTGPLLAAAPAAATSSGCATGALPVTVVGSPDLKAKQALGVYLWHDANGYSLRATHPGKHKVVISGSITTSRHIGPVTRVRLEAADRVTVGPRRHTVDFRFTNYGYIDGFTFKAQCSEKVTVRLRIDAAQASPAQVFLGKSRTNPTSVPFTIERTRTQ